MGWTYTSLRDAVRDHLDPTGDGAFDAQMPTFVRQAEERILHVTKLQAFRHTQAFPNVMGEVVAQINSLMAPISMRASSRPLLLKEMSWIAEVYGENTTMGTPQYYALRTFGGVQTEVVVAPPPAAPTNYVMEYFQKPLSLTEVPPGEETWISRNAENALFQGVLYYAYAYEKGEADMLAAYLTDFEKAMSLLKGMTRTDMRRDEFRSSPQPMPEA